MDDIDLLFDVEVHAKEAKKLARDTLDWDDQDVAAMTDLLFRIQDMREEHDSLWGQVEELDSDDAESQMIQKILNAAADDLEMSDVSQVLKSDIDKARKLKPAVTVNSLKRVYNQAKNSYDESYAMMVDDAFGGGADAAASLGITWVYDAGVFPLMFRNIKAFRSWDRVSDVDKKEMSRLARSV